MILHDVRMILHDPATASGECKHQLQTAVNDSMRQPRTNWCFQAEASGRNSGRPHLVATVSALSQE
jgi:hypothetical protein